MNPPIEFPEPPRCNLRIAKDIRDFCELARHTRQMGYIWGPNQSGKTIGAEMCAENRDDTIFVRLSAGGPSKVFIEDLMVAIGEAARSCYGDMLKKAMRFFKENRGRRMLLIVDELHEAFIGRSLKMVTIELIRNIHDIGKCGVVCIGTTVIPDMFRNERLKPFLAQSSNRGVLRRMVPIKPYSEDVTALANSYGFSPLRESPSRTKVWEIANENGIGKLCKYFQVTQFLAQSSRRKITWEIFDQAIKALDDYERGRPIGRDPNPEDPA